jgi:hypothetical protein
MKQADFLFGRQRNVPVLKKLWSRGPAIYQIGKCLLAPNYLDEGGPEGGHVHSKAGALGKRGHYTSVLETWKPPCHNFTSA